MRAESKCTYTHALHERDDDGDEDGEHGGRAKEVMVSYHINAQINNVGLQWYVELSVDDSDLSPDRVC